MLSAPAAYDGDLVQEHEQEYVHDHERLSRPPLVGHGLGAAVLSGLIIFGGIVGSYLIVARLGWLDAAALVAKMQEVGLTTLQLYLLGAFYWCTVNSLIEEYVWRWFVFTRCERIMPRYWAVAASALFFTVHHVIAAASYFDWKLTIIASLGVFIGGATWSWLCLRYRNIYAAYISHVFADIAIFGIG